MMRRNDHTSGETLAMMIRDPRYKPKLYQKKIEEAWQDMMGTWVYRETRSIRVKDQTLTIKISSASLREELSYMREKIREKINEMLGEEYISEVIVR